MMRSQWERVGTHETPRSVSHGSTVGVHCKLNVPATRLSTRKWSRATWRRAASPPIGSSQRPGTPALLSRGETRRASNVVARWEIVDNEPAWEKYAKE